MTNADKFKSVFGLYATELWAKPEKDFLEWLNADAELFGNSEQLNDTISRAAVVDEIEGVDWYHINRNGEMVHGANDAEHQAWYKADDIYAAIERVPSTQSVNTAKLQPNCNQVASDCISRQAALDAIKKLEKPAPTAQHLSAIFDCEDTIEALPSAQPEQRWIPCSERLPEDEEEVIVSVRDDSGDNTLDYSSCGWYACAGDFWVVDNEANERVVAWMPLPKPWKGEKHVTSLTVLPKKSLR